MSALKIADRDGITVVTFARPPVSAMDSASLEELAATFERLAGDVAVKAAVLTGEGNAFSAGLDLKTVPHLDLAGQRRLVAADVPLKASLAEVRVGVKLPVAALQVAIGELSPPAARRMVLFSEIVDVAGALSLGVFDESVPAASLLPRSIDRARRFAALPPQAFATTKSELRAIALGRIATARTGSEPRYADWISEETQAAAQATLRPAP